MLLELLEGTVSTSADRLALVSAERVWTYADLGNAVEERATELATKGVEPGRVYVIDAHAEAKTVIEFLAYWRTGASIAPLDPRLTRLEKRCSMVLRPMPGQFCGPPGREVDPGVFC